MDNLKISEIEKYKNKDFGDSHLKLKFSHCHYSILNSLRRVAISQVPIYAFDVSKIKVLKNTSVYNNSQLALRISQLPIPNINHDIDYLEHKYYFNVDFNDVKEKHPKDTFDIDYYVKSINNGDDLVKYVTTNDLKVNINNEEINYNDENPILLIKLRQGEEVEFSSKASLSIGETNSIFNASSCYYNELDEDNIEFTVKSNRQLSEYTILLKSCEILVQKMILFKELLSKQDSSKIENDKMFIMNIDNEDYTLMNPINYFLQNSDKVEFCGIARYNGFLEKNIRLKIKTKNNLSPIDEIEKAIDKSIDIYRFIRDELENLDKGKSKTKKEELKEEPKEEKIVKKTVKKSKK